MTIKEIAENAKCRRGKAAGVNGSGAYWMPFEAILLRSAGGDGIGHNSADLRYELVVRHYRNGTIESTVRVTSWHQNHGRTYDWMPMPQLLDCTTIEQLEVELLKEQDENGSAVYARGKRENLLDLGLPEAEPAPDEVLEQAE